MKVIILWWIGTDVDHFVNIWTHEEQQRVRNLGARNITVSIGNQQELVDCKVMSEVITLVPQPEKDLQPCPLPKEFTVSIYLPAKWKDTWFSYYYGVLRLHKYQDLLRIMGYTPNIQYKVYGNTSDIDFKGLNNVQVLGWIESPESVIRASSCHLRLTTHDGFPQSIIEAILLGRHVITNHEYPVIPAIIRPNDIVARLNEIMNKKEIVDPTVTNAYKLFCEREREKARALIKTLAFTPLTGGGCLTFVQEIAKKLPCNVVDACIPDKEMYNRLIASGVTIIPQAEGYISPVINSITSMPLYIAHAFYSAEDIRIHPPLKYSNDSILANAKKAIKVLTLSDSTKDWLIKNGIPKEKITVFRNPIDIDDLQRKKESRKSLFLNRPDVKKAGITEGNFYLYIGFDSHVKNPYQFRRLAVGFPQDKFIMMGYNLEKYAGTNCLVIPFTDHDTALGAIAAAKMLIITSSHESGPRVLLEAIVQGTPAITTLDGLGQDEINRVVFGTRQAAFGYYPDDEKRLFEIFSNLKKMSKDSILKLREGKCNIEQYDIKNCIHYFEEAIQ
jgi:glycosyltransferase involved in cell wall biosynthesis